MHFDAGNTYQNKKTKLIILVYAVRFIGNKTILAGCELDSEFKPKEFNEFDVNPDEWKKINLASIKGKTNVKKKK